MIGKIKIILTCFLLACHPWVAASAGVYWLETQGNGGIYYELFYKTSTGDRVAYSLSSGSWTSADNCSYNIEIWGL